MDNSKVIRNEVNVTFSDKNKENKYRNNDFAFVDIRLAYAGRNRNMTDLSKSVLTEALPSLAGCPIIGEYIYEDRNCTDGHFGGHGGKITISDDGIKYEITTKPYGFIPEEAVASAKWVDVVEKSGTHREYLTIYNAVVWLDRYPELNDILDKPHGQSFEIKIDGSYDSEGYLVAKAINYSACCILGNCSPCFESASISRVGNYSLDSFKQDMKYMLDKYNKSKNKEAKQMDLSKIKSKLSEFTYKNELGEDCEQYALVSVTDDTIGVFDRQDYNVYSFDYTMDGENLVFDDTSKKLGSCAVVAVADKDEIAFSISDEVNTIKSVCQTQLNKVKEDALTETCNTLSEEYSKKVDELTATYATLEEEYKTMKADYERLREADENHKFSLHKAEIDGVIGEYKSRIGMYPKYLVYCSKVDYSKTAEEVRHDLTLIAGEAAMNKNAKRSFSYEPTEAGCVQPKHSEKYAAENRYGNLLDRFKK